jgi:hypothetical protein
MNMYFSRTINFHVYLARTLTDSSISTRSSGTSRDQNVGVQRWLEPFGNVPDEDEIDRGLPPWAFGRWALGRTSSLSRVQKARFPWGHESIIIRYFDTPKPHFRSPLAILQAEASNRHILPMYHAPAKCPQSFPLTSHSALHWLRYSTYSKSATNKASRGRRKSLYDALAPPQLLTLPFVILPAQLSSRIIIHFPTD